VADELFVEVVREAHVDRPVPLVEALGRLVAADTLELPDPRVARDREQLVVMVLLQRLEPDARADELYVKRQPSPPSYERRMRRATTILCTSSGPS
jgi:hypothetical protein